MPFTAPHTQGMNHRALPSRNSPMARATAPVIMQAAMYRSPPTKPRKDR